MKEFETPTLDKVTDLWSTMMKNSDAARKLFKKMTGEHAKHKAKVKWFAAWMVQEQISTNWPQSLAVIRAPGTFFPETRKALAAILSDPEKCKTLQMELCLVSDVGRSLVLLCYLEEGDDFLSPRVLRRIKATELKLKSIVTADAQSGYHAPQVTAKATEIYSAGGALAVGRKVLETIAKAKNVYNKFMAMKHEDGPWLCDTHRSRNAPARPDVHHVRLRSRCQRTPRSTRRACCIHNVVHGFRRGLRYP